MSSLSKQIAAHPFFTADVSALPFDERIALAYQRAQLILRTYSELFLCWSKRVSESVSSRRLDCRGCFNDDPKVLGNAFGSHHRA